MSQRSPLVCALALGVWAATSACGGGGEAIDGGTSDLGAGADAGDLGGPGSDAGDLGGADLGACAVPDGDADGHMSMACGGDDCDDADPARYPGATEVCDAADRDEDCDDATFGTTDVDTDGVVSVACCNGTHCGTDCDDGNPSVNPTTSEVCNGIDDNCDGMVDEGLRVTLYPDTDSDGFGDAGGSITGCPGTTGYAMSGMDCDDTNVDVHPGATEICDGVDDNCDGVGDAGLTFTVYRDVDGDGYGSHLSGTMSACTPPAGYAAYDTDCDDAMSAVYPGATEVCNSRDDNCNGLTDENLGVACDVGVGACRNPGALRCDGSCTATAGVPDTGFHTSPAPNGSWDWNCDGTLTGNPPDAAYAVESTVAADCAGLSTTDCNYACAETPSFLRAPPAGPPPYCGEIAFSGSCCFTMPGVCGYTPYGDAAIACR